MFSLNRSRGIFLGIIPLLIACTALWACGSPAGRAEESVEAPVSRDVGSEEDLESVNGFIDSFQEIYSARNLSGLSALFLENGKVVVDSGESLRAYTTENWLSLTERIFESTSRISDKLTEREIKVYGDIAVVVCRYDYDSQSEHSSGHDIFSLLRKNDEWLIVSLMYHVEERN